MPTISAIIPVYNTAEYLNRCIDSILAQTYTDFELLLVDDGSTDSSGAICDEYAAKDSRVRVFHQGNQGQAAARNHALDWMFANSDSEYISFIDSDDWVHPRYLELLLEAIRKFNVNISQCGHVLSEKPIDFPALSGEISLISVEEEYIHWYSGTIWEKLFRRSCFSSIRFPEGQIYEDVAIWYKILFAEEKVGLVKDALYFYFISPNSTVQKDWTPPRFARILAWDDILRYLDNYGNRNVLQNAVGRCCRVARGHYKEINRSTAVTRATKIKYIARIRRRLKRILLKYKWAIEADGLYTDYCELAFPLVYPVYSWVYWTNVGIKKKLKRILRINGHH